MLTRKQHELLLFIHERLGQGGVSPSFDEMKDALGLKSKSGIHRLITGLEERGFIRRLPHRARALEVLRLPEGLDAARSRTAPKPKFQPNVIKGDFAFAGRDTAPPAPTPAAGNETVQLPLYGRIAAGTPIEALRDNSAFVDIPASMLTSGDHYALEVSGDSMIEAGILDHDTIIIQRCDSAENGTIVVALVDEGEVTLKRLRRKGNTVALEPANAAYETRIFGADRVRVQGKLIGLVRKY
ncbi:LexA family transcriptional regulator [Azospirillum sp. TSH100]|uniref:transcriptional repressor LexA n=1 Tax=Azospirillum sp. TSH100 TaxID=652764 RepID=UPI000D619983|nr:transcriptional repressor LexA [Azospirillum sp. TSH100]PWC87831.1 LexA family transcriptional regulator [Azospirillum sp. TSH100]QCG88234.1 transcriptional repressor LexA [Azospirillum sp. TSH100]